MNSNDILDMVGDAKSTYIWDAQQIRNGRISVTKNRKYKQKVYVLAAAIAAMLLLVGCTVAYAYTNGLLTEFFKKQSDDMLSSDQLSYLAENEQFIGESQTHDRWTVQLKSTINDGRTAYIILGVTAPKKIDLESSGTTDYYLTDEFAELISSNQVEILSAESGWESDNDGLSNTLDYVIRFEPIVEDGTSNPYGPDVKWNIHIENIVAQSTDIEYYQELVNGKYKGQDNFELTGEEIEQLYQIKIVAKGIWDFNFIFNQSNAGVASAPVPVKVKGYASRNGEKEYKDVVITDFKLYSFGAEIYHEADALVRFANSAKGDAIVMMHDGTQIELHHRRSTRDMTVLESDIPIVISEVDYIRMPDGTILDLS